MRTGKNIMAVAVAAALAAALSGCCRQTRGTSEAEGKFAYRGNGFTTNSSAVKLVRSCVIAAECPPGRPAPVAGPAPCPPSVDCLPGAVVAPCGPLSGAGPCITLTEEEVSAGPEVLVPRPETLERLSVQDEAGVPEPPVRPETGEPAIENLIPPSPEENPATSEAPVIVGDASEAAEGKALEVGVAPDEKAEAAGESVMEAPPLVFEAAAVPDADIAEAADGAESSIEKEISSKPETVEENVIEMAKLEDAETGDEATDPETGRKTEAALSEKAGDEAPETRAADPEAGRKTEAVLSEKAGDPELAGVIPEMPPVFQEGTNENADDAVLSKSGQSQDGALPPVELPPELK